MSTPRAPESACALQIRLNGAPREVPPGTHVAGLVALLGMQGRRVAVAVNRSIVPRSHYARVLLRDGDRVEVLEAVGGG